MEGSFSHKKVFLLGNPNCGKTSLFNALTGERRHVGNWPGVTVERIEGGREHKNFKLTFIDLPGSYSLNPFTPEEAIALTILDEASNGLFLNIIDSGNLERNLVLTFQLLEIGIRPILVFNCYDELLTKGGKINLTEVQNQTGCLAITTIAPSKKGIPELLDLIVSEQKAENRSVPMGLSDFWQSAMERICKSQGLTFFDLSPSKRLEAENILGGSTEATPDAKEIREQLFSSLSESARLTSHTSSNLACFLALNRYERIRKFISTCLTLEKEIKIEWKERLDGFLTHKIFGFPILIALMILVFWTTFSVGSIPAGWIQQALGWLSQTGKDYLPEGLVSDLLINGLLAGVGGVLVFLPNVLILFLWLAILEDSGYMARAVFLMDRFMQTLGLHGRAFIPMAMSLGCNVPAVMATKILEDPLQRLRVIFLLPLVPCSARLPVLVLLCGAFFPRHPSLVLFLLYFINLLVILILGRVSQSLFRSSRDSYFLLEMPPYRWPTPRSVFLLLWEKASHFVKKAGTVILCGTILIWFLSSFPRTVPLTQDFDEAISELSKQGPSEQIEKQIEILASKRDQEQLSGRYLAKIGNQLLPIVKPIGFGWREAILRFFMFPALQPLELFIVKVNRWGLLLFR
ncbi:ferrous iron transport protein B [bacterium]|nr:ferrous iron transport protein B [bacterium]